MKNKSFAFLLIALVSALISALVSAFSASADTEGMFNYSVFDGKAELTGLSGSGVSGEIDPDTGTSTVTLGPGN